MCDVCVRPPVTEQFDKTSNHLLIQYSTTVVLIINTVIRFIYAQEEYSFPKMSILWKLLLCFNFKFWKTTYYFQCNISDSTFGVISENFCFLTDFHSFNTIHKRTKCI